jgi:hypothetical protein
MPMPTDVIRDARGTRARYSNRCVLILVALVGVIASYAAPALASTGSALPDGRQWELVTPINKHGSGIKAPPPEGGVVEASESGSALSYISSAPLGEAAEGNRSLEVVQNLAERSGGSWHSRDLSTRNATLGEFELGHTTEYEMFAGNLSTALVEPRGDTPLPPLAENADQEQTLYLRDDAGAAYTALVTPANTLPGSVFGQPGNKLEFRGASPQLEQVVFSSPEALTDEVATNDERRNLYEWDAGRLALVSVLPSGHPASEPGGALESEESELGWENEVVRNAISSDGTRVIWQTTQSGGHLYLRDMTSKETVQLDTPEAGLPEQTETPKPEFQGANEEGTRVFFTDVQRLTAGSHAEANAPDLYAAELVPGTHLAYKITDLTEDTNEEEPAKVKGLVLGYSSSGSYIYYVADGMLTPGAGQTRCQSEEAQCSLFMDHYDSTTGHWTTSLIATLSGNDGSDWGDPSGRLVSLTARVSPNGQYLAFMSQEQLTGYDNDDIATGIPDKEVFLYDAATNGLRCVSCNPSGEQPRGLADPAVDASIEAPLVDPAKIWQGKSLAASIPSWTPSNIRETFYQPRYLSNSGRVFFDAADALVPADSNQREDVYEYEPEGAEDGECNAGTQSASETYVQQTETEGEATGGAHAGVAAGCVALISAGSSSEESVFLDASVSGEDVFLLTTSQLTPEDNDGAFDIYDAHVCSASSPCPAASAASGPSCSSAETCRTGVSTQPVGTGEPASAIQTGNGNLVPAVVPAVTKPKAKAPTTAEKRAQALKVCKKLKAHKKRLTCERQTKKKYPLPSKASKSKASKSNRKGN